MFELTDVGGHAGGSGAREGSRLFPRDLGRLPRDSRLSLTVHLPGIPLRGTHHKNRRGLPSDLKNEKGCSGGLLLLSFYRKSKNSIIAIGDRQK
jgi:hypothetical protein